ncbi:hypothetical protein B5F19_14415 [Pseudoflavonifractor sp. An184]|nr:hypothetical protein B5F19_14415 [Pseudoflavonifractor sp. An184]
MTRRSASAARTFPPRSGGKVLAFFRLPEKSLDFFDSLRQRQSHGFGAVFFRHAFARISEAPCGLSELLQEMFQIVSDSFSSLQFLNILFAGIILLFSAIGNILGWQLF